MALPFELALGVRYVRRSRGGGFVSFISTVSILGIATGVFVLIVVLSVMNGFERELRTRILDVTAHGAITGYEGLMENWQDVRATALADPRVAAVAPFLEGQGLVTAATSATSGVLVRGVQPAEERLVAALDQHFLRGSLDRLDEARFSMVLGEALAQHLGVDVGDSVTLLVPEANITPAGLLPRMRRFEVAGIFSVGMYDFDRRLAYVSLRDAQALYRAGDAVTGLRLRFDDLFDAPRAVREIALAAGSVFYIRDWTREQRSFFRAITLTKQVMFVILLLVVAVAAFNIVSTLIMVVNEKNADIAILRTVGASPASILGVFVLQGAIIGLLGTLAGVAAGVLVTLNLESLVAIVERWLGESLIAASVYLIDELPAELAAADVVLIALTAFALTLVSTLYPAWRAAVTQPAEALRHEG
jgi:lipoprotein-releasing system permease protein